MSALALSPGFSGYVAFGWQWGVKPGQAQNGGAVTDQGNSSQQKTIDVQARRVIIEEQRQAQNSSILQPSATSSSQLNGNVMTTLTYAPSLISGQAPRLRGAASPPGQYIDTWA